MIQMGLCVQVKTNYRTAVTIPEKSWSRFRDIFSDYVDKMKDGGGGGAGASATTPTSSSVADSSPGPASGSHKSVLKWFSSMPFIPRD